MNHIAGAVLSAAVGAAPQIFELSVIAAVILLFSAMGYVLTKKR